MHLADAFRKRNLASHIVLLDKGKGPGGRCATRRIDEASFDTGFKQYRVRDEQFSDVHSGWVEQGVVEQWANGEGGPGLVHDFHAWSREWMRDSSLHITTGFKWPTDDKGEELVGKLDKSARWKFVGTATSLPKTMVKRLETAGAQVRFGAEVDRVEFDKNGWIIKLVDRESIFSDVLVFSCPMVQTVNIIKRSKMPMDALKHVIPMLEQVEYHESAQLLIPVTGLDPGHARNASIAISDVSLPDIGHLFIEPNQLVIRLSDETSTRYYTEEWTPTSLLEKIKPNVSNVLSDLGISNDYLDALKPSQIKTWRFANCRKGITGRRFLFSTLGGTKECPNPLPIVFIGDAFTKELPGLHSTEWTDTSLGLQRAVMSGTEAGTMLLGLLPALSQIGVKRRK